MNTELEDTLREALRSRAGAMPPTPMPRLGRRAAAPPAARRGWLVPVAAAAVAVVGIGAAVLTLTPADEARPPAPPATQPDPSELQPGEVYYSITLGTSADGGVIIERELWQPRDRAGAWQQKVVAGRTLAANRVVPSDDRIEAPPGGECYPATKASDAACTAPAGWFNPTPEFLATAPRDPAVIKEALRAAAIAEEQKRTGPDGDFTETEDTFSDANLNYLELNYLRGVLESNGLPPDLSAALRQVVAAMPGIRTEPMGNLLGEHGTGYSLPNEGGQLLSVIFDEHGGYLGAPSMSVHHGVAPGLGRPPSRMLD